MAFLFVFYLTLEWVFLFHALKNYENNVYLQNSFAKILFIYDINDICSLNNLKYYVNNSLNL